MQKEKAEGFEPPEVCVANKGSGETARQDGWCDAGA